MRFQLRFVAVLVLVLSFFASGGLRASENARSYVFAPAHSWVTAAAFEPSAPSPSDGAIVDELVDDQVRFGATLEHYARRVRRITSITGVEGGGQISIEFDPGYQKLTVHTLRIVRGAETIDARTTATFRVLEQESDLDERLYNGKQTLSIVIGDLRVGDVTDLEYTVSGQNPVFAGHTFGSFALATPRGVKHLRARILTPESRPVVHRTEGIDLAPVTRIANGEREDVWERRDVPAVVDEDRTPAWFVSVPVVSVSEFQTWGDVVRWATPLFEHPMPRAAGFDERVARIAAQSAGPEERALAALRFVQDEVRYLGMELGESSHRPHEPAVVLAQRFGDCKDKALLLVTLLRALGVSAHVALVNTELRAHLDPVLPSPGVFDHAIVRIELPRGVVWVDATRTHERGALGAVPVRFERALVIAPGETTLEPIEAGALAVPTVETLEQFVVDGFHATLDVATTYRGEEASFMRRRFATSTREQLKKSYLDFYTSEYKSIESVGDLSVEDDAVRDVLVVREKYAIQDALPERALDVSANGIRSELHKPRVRKRAAPLAVGDPMWIRHTVEIRGAQFSFPTGTDIDSKALRFRSRTEVKGNVTRLDFDLRTVATEVAPSDVDLHVAAITSIFDATALSLPLAEPPPVANQGPTATTFAWWLGIIGTIALVVVSGSIRRWLRRRRWARKARVQAGETPARPAGVASRSDAERVLVAGRCSCGSELGSSAAESAWTALRFAERDVLAGRVSCAGCGEARVRYFSIE